MDPLRDCREFLTENVPLAPLTWFRLGGSAQYLAKPRSAEDLATVIQACAGAKLPWRILAGGSNILVRDEGVEGVVIHLESPAFSDIKIKDRRVEAGAAVPLTALISQSARSGLAGLEILTGIPGTVGGALAGNSGSRQGAIGQFAISATVLDHAGTIQDRERDDLQFAYRWSNLDDVIILSVVFELERDDPELVVRRMRRIWIVKKENQPYGHQSSGCIFKDPNTEVTARMLIDQAGLKGLRVGGAEVSDRHANYIVAHADAKSADVLALIEQVQSQVRQRFSMELEPQLQVW
jgi:UDP-N-acetylmuramate dehydrogenase